MLRFLHAGHRDLYVRLALKYLKSPERIYHLAHGSNPKNEKEKKIRRELLDRGILRRTDGSHSHYHRHENTASEEPAQTSEEK